MRNFVVLAVLFLSTGCRIFGPSSRIDAAGLYEMVEDRGKCEDAVLKAANNGDPKTAERARKDYEKLVLAANSWMEALKTPARSRRQPFGVEGEV